MTDSPIGFWREYEYTDMDEVLPNLWIGDMWSAKDVSALKKRNIRSVVSVMRGQVDSRNGFKHCHIPVDDSETEDLLRHFPKCIQFMEEELSKGFGVLVHCQAGISRSATIVTAYLMFTQQIDSLSALKLVEKVRPCVQPNDGFLRQLDIFHQASFRVSVTDQATRLFYLRRSLEGNNHNDLFSNDLASDEHTPFDNQLSTSINQTRVIRCKMCRQELATGEHILHLFPDEPSLPGQPSSLSHFGQSKTRKHSVEKPSSSSTDTTGFPSKIHSTNSTSAQARDSGIAVEPVLQYKEVGVVSNSSQNVDAEPDMNTPLLPTTTKLPAMKRPIMQPEDLSTDVSIHAQAVGLRTAQTMRSPDCATISPRRIGTSCSGYFIEAMPWMRTFLSQGQSTGKIICPNERCSAKLGNYDWAGMSCGCKEWIVPGFCMHRSKVDEIL
ncbi:phosphatases II [Rickenella mellea]|uniref:protein-tyrosine-phosphatase n=1 Tax=Rickenella mellea TaxID=50990 RepID=A0A4Y7PJE5_9AGAM|nr:phosphatases II [Rickenella mellea]